MSLSEDHKPAQESEKARITAAGGFVSDIGGVPRVNGNLNLSRAIGDLKYKTNSALPVEAQIITAHPDVRVFELGKEDRFFILACDGVWDVMTNQVNGWGLGIGGNFWVEGCVGASGCTRRQRWSSSHPYACLQQAVKFVETALDQGQKPHEVAAAVVDACLAHDPKQACGIGCDNMTCIVITLDAYQARSCDSA